MLPGRLQLAAPEREHPAPLHGGDSTRDSTQKQNPCFSHHRLASGPRPTAPTAKKSSCGQRPCPALCGPARHDPPRMRFPLPRPAAFPVLFPCSFPRRIPLGHRYPLHDPRKRGAPAGAPLQKLSSDNVYCCKVLSSSLYLLYLSIIPSSSRKRKLSDLR